MTGVSTHQSLHSPLSTSKILAVNALSLTFSLLQKSKQIYLQSYIITIYHNLSPYIKQHWQRLILTVCVTACFKNYVVPSFRRANARLTGDTWWAGLTSINNEVAPVLTRCDSGHVTTLTCLSVRGIWVQMGGTASQWERMSPMYILYKMMRASYRPGYTHILHNIY